MVSDSRVGSYLHTILKALTLRPFTPCLPSPLPPPPPPPPHTQRGAVSISSSDFAQGTIIEMEEALHGEEYDPWQSITVLWDDEWSHLQLRSKVGKFRGSGGVGGWVNTQEALPVVVWNRKGGFQMNTVCACGGCGLGKKGRLAVCMYYKRCCSNKQST